MAQDKIGDVQFDLVENQQQPHAMREGHKQFQRDGIDGHEVLAVGTRGPVFTWSGCYKWSSSSANALSFIADVEALEGTIVSVYDTYAQQYDNILVRSVGLIGTPRACEHGGTVQYQTVFAIEMQRVA